jgi:hypothetical protein
MIMYDADAIEAINFEQLVTATDRLLLRHGRRRRLPPAREPFSVPSLALRPARITSTIPGYRVSGPRFARGSQPRLLRKPESRVRWVATTVIIPALIGTIAGLLMLL